MIYRGSCHCGRIRIEVEGQLERVGLCNCSICSKKGYLHWIVPRERVRLLGEEAALSTYRFNTGVARHHFCRECGVACYYVPRSDPDRIDVNVRCLEGVDSEALAVDRFDGRNWEQSIEAFRRR